MKKFFKVFFLIALFLIVIFLLPPMVGDVANYLTSKGIKPEAEKRANALRTRLKVPFEKPEICSPMLECNSFIYYLPYLKRINSNHRKTIPDYPLSPEIYIRAKKFLTKGVMDTEAASKDKKRLSKRLDSFTEASCCRYFSLENYIEFEGFSTPVPLNYIETIRNLRTFLYLAAYNFKAGQHDEAFKIYRIALRLLSDLSTTRLFLFGTFTSLSWTNYCYAFSLYTFTSRESEENLRRKILDLLEKLKWDKRAIPDSLESDATFFLWTAAKVSVPMFHRITSLDQYKRFYLKYWRDLFSSAKFLKQIFDYYIQVARAYREAQEMAGIEGVVYLEKKENTLEKQHPRASAFVGRFARVYKREKTAETLFRLNFIAFELEKFMEEKGEYPENLDTLKIAKEFRIDPVTGKEFIYRRVSKTEAQIVLPGFSKGEEFILRFCPCPVEERWQGMTKFMNFLKNL